MYSMEGLDVLQTDDMKKGLLPRVVNGLFDHIASAGDSSKFKIKMSMVEIYMETVRDLFNLANDNLPIEQNNENVILVSGVTEIHLSGTEEALQKLHAGILNRAVGETRMNLAGSRSHCLYIFTVQQELTGERTRTGKLVLVDLAGPENTLKTGAEGSHLEEAESINKSLGALRKVIFALIYGSSGPIPYGKSKLTMLLQDTLGGNSRTALIHCCSPNLLHFWETLSTLHFSTREMELDVSTQMKEEVWPFNDGKHFLQISQHIMIRSVRVWKRKTNLKATLAGFGKIGGVLFETGGEFWCDWLGGEPGEEETENHDSGIIIFPFHSRLGTGTTYTNLCTICNNEMRPGLGVATIYNEKSMKLCCSGRNKDGTFHTFHITCLVLWVLKWEFKSRTDSEWLDCVLCPSCGGSGMVGEDHRRINEAIEKFSSYKAEVLRGYEEWMKDRAVGQTSIGCLCCQDPDGQMETRLGLLPSKIIRFYKADYKVANFSL